jgi:hypothetical protein
MQRYAVYVQEYLSNSLIATETVVEAVEVCRHIIAAYVFFPLPAKCLLIYLPRQ